MGVLEFPRELSEFGPPKHPTRYALVGSDQIHSQKDDTDCLKIMACTWVSFFCAIPRTVEQRFLPSRRTAL